MHAARMQVRCRSRNQQTRQSSPKSGFGISIFSTQDSISFEVVLPSLDSGWRACTARGGRAVWKVPSAVLMHLGSSLLLLKQGPQYKSTVHLRLNGFIDEPKLT